MATSFSVITTLSAETRPADQATYTVSAMDPNPGFRAGVLAELANRGIKDVLIVCCDGLTGLPDAIAAA